MAVIKQFDKRTGITYVYESHSFWDPEKRMTRAKRSLIGRLDPATGEVVPTDGRNRKAKNAETTDHEQDYKKLYEKLLKKCEAQQKLISSLEEQLKKAKEANK